jgi:NAD kinase
VVPRVVVVRRKTDYELLLERHGTHEQARFYLRMREQDVDEVRARHERVCAEYARVAGAIPTSWRRARVDRADLHRFLFEPEDVIVAFGQDGLVANIAKYLHGQPVIGINAEPDRNDGVLVPCRAAEGGELMQAAAASRVTVERRTMVQARLDDGQRLLALNEIFVGHERHQSARYHLQYGPARERQSSSGIVVATGTGATGWARSIHRQRHTMVTLPTPSEQRLAFFVREAFPSIATGTELTDGAIATGDELVVSSRMNGGGVVFGDGIEADRLVFGWGATLTVDLAPETLMLVKPT